MFTLKVIDKGPGISSEEFSPPACLADGRVCVTADCLKGVGMSVSMLFARDYLCGSLTLRNRSDGVRGAVATLSIPLPEVVSHHAHSDEKSPWTVLVVDDSPIQRRIMKALLGSLVKSEVLVARDEDEAVEYCRRGAGVDVALLDLHLGCDVRGDDVGRRLQEILPELRVWLVTGDVTFLAPDGFGLLTKPVSKGDLRRVFG